MKAYTKGNELKRHQRLSIKMGLSFRNRQKNLFKKNFEHFKKCVESSVPFKVISAWSRSLSLLANIGLQKLRWTRLLTVFERVEFVVVAFTASVVERHTSLFKVVKIPEEEK